MVSSLISLGSIARKEVNRVFRIWAQTLLPPVITQSLYFLIFGAFIGSRIDRGGVFAENLQYIEFVAPGLMMMAIITGSFSNVVSSFFGAKWQRHIEEVMVSPTPNWVIIAGYAAGGVVRGLLVSLLVFGVSLIFVNPEIHNFFMVFAFATMTAVLFALGGFANGLFAKKFDDVSIFPTFVLTPLTYLGGVFYSIDKLPEFWQNLSRINPIVYMIDGFRFGFYGFSDFSVYLSLLFLTGFVVLLWVFNLVLLRRGFGLKS
jgi:ABC-2 type transport system permease protein